MDNLAQNLLHLLSSGEFNLGLFAQTCKRHNRNKIDEQLTVKIIDGICDLLPLHEQIRERLAEERDNTKLVKYIEIAEKLLSEHEKTDDSEHKVRIMREFIDSARNYCDIDVFYTSSVQGIRCQSCGMIWKDESLPVCENCNIVMKYGDELDSNIEIKKKEKSHNSDSFANYLYNNYLGNISPSELETLSNNIVPKILAYFGNRPELEPNNRNMITCLKDIKEKSNLKNITVLCHLAWGYPKPSLKQHEITCIMTQYEFVTTAYEQIKKSGDTTRSSALNSPYVLAKLMERLKIEFDPYNLKPIETESIQVEHDELWQKICQINLWSSGKMNTSD